MTPPAARLRGPFALTWLAAAMACAAAACQPAPPGPDPSTSGSSTRIRHIMPWPAGSGSDIAMRGFLSHLERHLGGYVFTENISGGITARGMLRLKASPADGSVIGTMTYDILTVEYFDLVPVNWRDFEILGTVTEHPSALIARAGRWPGLEEFRLDAAGGHVKVGNVGSGSVFHQHAVGMETAMGIELVHVPYTSSGGQLGALLGGEVDAIVTALPAVLPHVQQGKLVVLGVMTDERHPLLPTAPTFRELGADVVFSSFRMLVVPKGTPASVRDRLSQSVQDAWNDPRFQDWAQKSGLGAAWKDPDESRAFLEELSPKVRAILSGMFP